MIYQPQDFLSSIAQVLFDKKARNILALDLAGVSSLTNYFVIAEGSVDRHVKALELAVKTYLEQMGYQLLHEEGQRTGDWVVMDYGDFMIHLFIPEMREKYSLEQVWRHSQLVDLKIDVGGSRDFKAPKLEGE